jgi:hypothetical protein
VCVGVCSADVSPLRGSLPVTSGSKRFPNTSPNMYVKNTSTLLKATFNAQHCQAICEAAPSFWYQLSFSTESARV